MSTKSPVDSVNFLVEVMEHERRFCNGATTLVEHKLPDPPAHVLRQIQEAEAIVERRRGGQPDVNLDAVRERLLARIRGTEPVAEGLHHRLIEALGIPTTTRPNECGGGLHERLRRAVVR